MAPPLTRFFILILHLLRLPFKHKNSGLDGGHQPLFAFNEDCFGERIFTCSRTAVGRNILGE